MAIGNSIIIHEHVYMTLEYPDGHVVHGKCLMASVEVERPYEMYDTFSSRDIISIRPSTTTIELVSDQLFFSESSEYVERVEKERVSPEWQCWYCGRPNKAKREVCASCNAVRQFIYR